MGESKGEREPHFGEKESGSEWEHGVERANYTMKKGGY